MNSELESKIKSAMADPQNMGEMPDADSVGTVGNSDCGEMLRMWVKYKEENGKMVIDKATFQSFGCETAIAVASLATELIKGKTADEALALKPEELSGELGPLPPMKIHCSELVQGALRSTLAPETCEENKSTDTPTAAEQVPSLMQKMGGGEAPSVGGKKITFLD